MVAIETHPPDLGALRGLSKKTLALFHVHNNGTGWEYSTAYGRDGGEIATRWKAYDSAAVPKYRWVPGKPDAAKYFYPPGCDSKAAVEARWNAAYLLEGDIGVMTLFETGLQNVLGTFGASNMPDTLVDDLKALGVETLHLIPDRDSAGLAWAVRIRDLLLEQLDITLIVHKLPFDFQDKHGKDVNDYWLDSPRKPAEFRLALAELPLWTLPEPEPKTTPLPHLDGDGSIPDDLKAELRLRLGVIETYNGGGWSRKNIRCPFHDDKVASATWNDESGNLFCHTCGNHNARSLCELFNIRMGDYYRAAPALELVKRSLPSLPASSEVITFPTPIPQRPPIVSPLQQFSPPLSLEARLNDDQMVEAQQGREWLDSYIQWTTRAGPLSPHIFYEAMGLWTLALASTRRLKVSIGGENIYPNLYMFIVAPTTVYRKSTALNLVTSLIDQAKLDCLLMPERATPEALFEYLAGKMPTNHEQLSERDSLYWSMGRTFAAQRAILEDEASGLLSEMKKDYNAGLSELLLKGYDGQGTLRKLLKSQGLLTVRDMCLSFLGATTPVEWSRRMGMEERQNGFVARFAIITPEGPPIYQDAVDDITPPEMIVKRLSHLFRKTLAWDERLIDSEGVPHPLAPQAEVMTPPITTLTISPEAFAQIGKYRKAMSYTMIRAAGAGGEVEEDKAGSYARLGTMMIKVAMLLAAVDTDFAPIRIEPCHAYAAQLICERWRESLHRLDSQVAASKYNNLDEKVLGFIRSGGELGVTARDIHRACNLESSGRAQELIKLLIDAGVVDVFKREGKGRPAICYKATT